MSDRSEPNVFAVQFAGNLRADSEPEPTRVVTRLRIRTEEADLEIQEYRENANSIPLYEFGAENPLMPASLQAVGRHSFSWQ